MASKVIVHLKDKLGIATVGLRIKYTHRHTHTHMHTLLSPFSASHSEVGFCRLVGD